MQEMSPAFKSDVNALHPLIWFEQQFQYVERHISRHLNPPSTVPHDESSRSR